MYEFQNVVTALKMSQHGKEVPYKLWEENTEGKWKDP